MTADLVAARVAETALGPGVDVLVDGVSSVEDAAGGKAACADAVMAWLDGPVAAG